MKQKRKVKSLLPQKNDWRSSFLTAVLLILSVALCIGSASLITSRVWAEEIHELTYTGLDDKQEVLYGMRFVDRNNMETTVNKMYMKNNSLYITPNPVVVNELSVGSTNFSDSNQVEGVYGHVLGGKGNKVKSKNVTLIAGEDNVVTEGNDNAAFLGGQSNKNFGSMREGGTPMVVVGGSNNSIGNDHDGVALIGGNGNKIGDNVSDSFILGGEDNEIESGLTNVIVGGKKVKVRTVNNVFVYSNKGDGTNPNYEFEPQSSDSFYLNVGNGVGINTNPSNRGLAVGGVVNLGEIDIKSVKCDQFNFGVEFSYGGCVVGCTKAGAAVNKWEMLDRGAHCQAVCGDAQDYCIYTGEVIEPAPSYDAFCTSAKTNKDIFTGHSHMCYTGELGEYQNVVYETSLIDSDKECPEKNENKCVYQCDQGYHLTGNFAGNDGGTVRCYQDCLYEWEDVGVKKYKHNETVIGYNVNIVACSNNVYMFPFDTEIIPAGTRTREGLSALIPAGISIGNKVINGRTYNNRATNGYSPETCGNYDHKKTLVCNNGTMYLVKNDGKKATNMKASDYGYKYNGCDTKNYRCDVDEYHLTKTDITKSFTDEGLQDSGNGWNNKKDREQFSLTRGQYKLCLDYNRVEGNNETCEIVDKLTATKLAHDEHYKFMGCNEHYTEYPEGSEHCMESCSATLNGGKYTDIPHGQTKDFYKSNEETCLDTCEWATFTCDDGKWIQSGTNQVRDETSPYQYYGCTQKDKLCDRAVYNVSQKEHDDHISTSLYEEKCDEYDGKQRNICDFTLTVYRLTGCKPGYHTENGKWCVDNVKDMACPSKPSNSHWVRTSALTSYPYSNIITKYKTYLNAGWYLVWWDENCAWNGPISSCWVYEYPDGNTDGKVIPGNACEWKCNIGYRDSGNYCQKIDTTCQYPDNNQNACVNTEPYACKDPDHTDIENQGLDSDGVTWRWDCVNGIESDRKHCMLCKDGYHIENGKCVPNVNGLCDNSIKYGCTRGYKAERTEYDSRYTWDCLGIPSADDSSTRKPGPNCTSATDDTGCYLCKQGYHKTSVYGECLINECSSTNRPSGDGVIYGEGTPDTHNKSWDYVSTSELGPCEWTCEEGYHKNGNGCEINKYKITYDGNGGEARRNGSKVEYDIVNHGESVYLPNAKRDCYEFNKWDGTLPVGTKYGPVTADATLVAHWTPVEYTITYNCDGGTGGPFYTYVTWGDTPTLRSSGCSKTNYKLIGWSKESGSTTVDWNLGATMDGELTSECTSKTLYAVYKEIDNGECYEEIPYGCMDNSDDVVEKGEITSDGVVVGVTWYCQGEDGKSPLCQYRCAEGERFDLNEKKCVSTTNPSTQDPITINVKCEAHYKGEENPNYCVSKTWDYTTYTVQGDVPVPVDVYIGQNMTTEGLATEQQGCSFHDNGKSTAVDVYKISAGSKVSTLYSQSHIDVSRQNGKGYDGIVYNGLSSFGNNQYSFGTWINTPTLRKEYTANNGQKYIINLEDCDPYEVIPITVECDVTSMNTCFGAPMYWGDGAVKYKVKSTMYTDGKALPEITVYSRLDFWHWDSMTNQYFRDDQSSNSGFLRYKKPAGIGKNFEYQGDPYNWSATSSGCPGEGESGGSWFAYGFSSFTNDGTITDSTLAGYNGKTYSVTLGPSCNPYDPIVPEPQQPESNGCGDNSEYGKSPWLHKDKLCADGWSLITTTSSSDTAPLISFETDTNMCKPVFKWQCKKGTTKKKCSEDSLNVAYVKLNIPSRFNGEVYVDEDLYSNNNATSVLGTPDDDIQVTMRYYNSIYDGNYNGQNLCQLPTNGQPRSKILPVEKIDLDYNDVGTDGWKIESFKYEPGISTIGVESYVLTPVWGSEQVFQPYTCRYVNNGSQLDAFHCAYQFYPQLQ